MKSLLVFAVLSPVVSAFSVPENSSAARRQQNPRQPTYRSSRLASKPNDHFSDFSASLASVLSCTLATSILLFTTIPLPADATETSPPTTLDEVATILNHNYADPLHPSCRRTITVDPKSTTGDITFQYKGSYVGAKGDTVPRGCTPDEVKAYGIHGEKSVGFIDWPKITLQNGSDGLQEGRWEPAGSVATSKNLEYTSVDGIRWQDGNKWTIKEDEPKPLSKAIGEFIFLAYVGFSTLAGFKGVYDKIQEKRARSS